MKEEKENKNELKERVKQRNREKLTERRRKEDVTKQNEKCIKCIGFDLHANVP